MTADAGDLDRALEALLIVATEPAGESLLAQLLEVSASEVRNRCEILAAHYAATDRGFELVRVAGGWRVQSHPDCASYVERFVLEGQSARLSAAALETLAIIAYKQPISRGQIAAIRGVNVDGVIRSLTQRGYVVEMGRDPSPGNPAMLGTTSKLLERLGLDALEDLPPLGEFVPGADVVEALEHGLRLDTGPADDGLADDAVPAVSE
ncbi:MAG TPA: SMC-Scp complex subunit ScpB [Acidimicrobiales bacterium]|jgi:segregation and condensation protein B